MDFRRELNYLHAKINEERQARKVEADDSSRLVGRHVSWQRLSVRHDTMLLSLMFVCFLPIALGYCYQTTAAAGQVGMVQSARAGCGLCPPQSQCLDLTAIKLGYCCGYRQNRDRVPIDCDSAAILCPPPSTLLWTDYNYLMDCCC